jgi:23S rRNA (cytosine1962-C5)-methyltransferase
MVKECTVRVKKGREKPILQGHPWVFSGAISEISHCRVEGELGIILDEDGRFLARGYVNRRTGIVVRILTTKDIQVDSEFIKKSIQTACELRARALGSLPGAYRVVNAEGDFLPGLVVDRYGGGIVVQCSTSGMQRLKGLVVQGLVELLRPQFIYEKSSGSESEKQVVDLSDSLLFGRMPERIIIEEEGVRFLVDIPGGQKTGFFLDQRNNRLLLAEIARDMEILNCFSYTGAFGVHALLGGAKSVLNVDVSETALEHAPENARLNDLDMSRFACVREDAFTFLRGEGRKWDAVILDPPKFARTKAELKGAARGYKDINLFAMKLIRPGGMLMTFSCSSHVTEDLFQKIVFGAAADASRQVQILKRLHAGADHPVNLAHREGEYLKGLLLRVL